MKRIMKTLFFSLTAILLFPLATADIGGTQTVELTHEGFTPSYVQQQDTVTVINMKSEPVYLHSWSQGDWVGRGDSYTFHNADYISQFGSTRDVIID